MERQLEKLRCEAGILCSFFLISLLILFPILPHLFSQLSFADNGDLRLSFTILFSNLKKITQGDLLNLFQLPIIFPLSHILTAGVNLFGQTLLLLPLYLLHIRNVYFLYNFLTFFAYIAAGYCAYLFVREWISERWIAWIIGALYILMPYRVHNIPQLNLMFNFPIPLALLFFSRFLKESRFKDLIFLFLALLAQFLFDLSIGLFLGITLAGFFVIRQLLYGFMPRRSFFLLAGGSMLFIVVMALIFLPYLSMKTSFSIIDEIRSIPDVAFHSPISFYSNWSYLLLLFKGVIWQHPPFSPGITVFFFFVLAFAPYLETRWQKILALFSLVFLVGPALAMPFTYKILAINSLNRICGWALLFFLASLALLLFVVRRRVHRPLLLLTITWIFLQFYSSQVSLPFFNIFQGMARVFSILLRARFIRTEYILLLLFFTISAFGLSHFFKRFREKKVWLALVLLLVFAERIRWPIHAEKFKDDRQNIRELYRLTAPYPAHFGLLELPFDTNELNHYSFFTVFHDKHTCHGHISYLKDHFKLSFDTRIQAKGKFSGLGDPEFIRSLKARGIRLILLIKNMRNNESKKAWFAMQSQTLLGQRQGLYEKIEKASGGTLLVLNECESGPRINYFLPHYALRGKKSLFCKLNARGESEAEFLLNGAALKKVPLQVGTVNDIRIDLDDRLVAMQFNYLQIRSGPTIELIRVRMN